MECGGREGNLSSPHLSSHSARTVLITNVPLPRRAHSIPSTQRPPPPFPPRHTHSSRWAGAISGAGSKLDSPVGGLAKIEGGFDQTEGRA